MRAWRFSIFVYVIVFLVMLVSPDQSSAKECHWQVKSFDHETGEERKFNISYVDKSYILFRYKKSTDTCSAMLELGERGGEKVQILSLMCGSMKGIVMTDTVNFVNVKTSTPNPARLMLLRPVDNGKAVAPRITFIASCDGLK
jgi:hypothetical protein